MSTFENQPPLDAPTKAQKKNRVFAQEVSQFEKEPPLDAPTKGLNFQTMPGTAVGATFESSKVGPE